MGSGIAETCLVAGHEVVLIRSTPEELAAKGYERIEKSLSRGVERAG